MINKKPVHVKIKECQKKHLFQVNSHSIFSGGACPFITELLKDFIKSIADCLPASSHP